MYVGAHVNPGTRLGTIGRFNSPHLHIEVRNFGREIGSPTRNENILVDDANGLNNSYGILLHNPNQAVYIYDFTQFYDDTVFDPQQGSGLSVNGFGVNVIVPADAFATPPGPSGTIIDTVAVAYRSQQFTFDNCMRRHSLRREIFDDNVPELVIRNTTANGFWGFRTHHTTLVLPPDPLSVAPTLNP
jgi:murein DD-endopeptidase MepM/ murein hydrolase activator NlpD